MSPQTDTLKLLLLLSLLTAIVLVPAALVAIGIHRFRGSRHITGVLLLATGLSVIASYVSAIVWLLDVTGPSHNAILVQGESPQGLEYCVVQTWTGMRSEPYQVSFYHRYQTGAWHWSYLDHEDLAWCSARVEFSENTATIFRNDKSFRDIPMPMGNVPDSVDLDDRHNDCPAKYTAADLLSIHNAEFGPR